MVSKDKVEEWAGRLNPYLARLAVGLAMVVVLMAYQHRGAPRLAPAMEPQQQVISPDEIHPLGTD